MARVILPGPQPPEHALTLIVPRGMERRQTGECYLCGAAFAEGDNVVAHMKACVVDAGHEVRAAHYEKKDRLSIFEPWDPEVASHLKKVGKRMLAEGRWTVNPNERAGFS